MAFKWAKERLKGGPKDQESLFFLENVIIESIGSFINSQIIFLLPSHPPKNGKKRKEKGDIPRILGGLTHPLFSLLLFMTYL